jgi:indole-3-glycerol phosphate synthase
VEEAQGSQKAGRPLGTCLEELLRSTRRRVAEAKGHLPQRELEVLARKAPSPRNFASALGGPGTAIIAEIKRASPSRGDLCAHLDPALLARAYWRAGAVALSVLTEPEFFRGSFEDLARAREATPIPVLAKGFFLDPYQLYQARAYGADAILLIARVLGERQLAELMAEAHSLGMAPLVEMHRKEEVRTALGAGTRLIGINNRDLENFSVDINTTIRLMPLIPKGVLVVSESGIKSQEDIEILKKSGVGAFLVGEALILAPDPEQKLRELCGQG